MKYRKTIQDMPVEMYERLSRALELGKWPDGQLLTPDQKTHAMQAVITWGELHLGTGQRVGYIDKGKKSGDRGGDPQVSSLNWINEKDK